LKCSTQREQVLQLLIFFEKKGVKLFQKIFGSH
jgi:hypothetical protein